MDETLVCWRCGSPIVDLPLPFGRTAECLKCRAELHVCRMCEFYDTTVAQSCREPVADEVKDKERANYCDYFRPVPDAYRAGDNAEASAARAKLEALFGNADSAADVGGGDGGAERAAREELEKLFRSDD